MQSNLKCLSGGQFGSKVRKVYTFFLNSRFNEFNATYKICIEECHILPWVLECSVQEFRACQGHPGI